MKILIFSGTSDGHALCRYLERHHIQADVFVATDYGEAVMEPMDGISVHIGRLTAQEMTAYMDHQTTVVDATHPYASEVSENIRSACTMTNAEYLRLLRPQQAANNAVIVPNTAAAVQWLCEHPGKILLTVGSKELEAYTAIPDYKNRIYPRVLPTSGVLSKCEALGFPGSSVIAMQGPFSHEMNVALFQKTGASILVTKDTGKNGGFAEKLSAAQDVGATVLMIARPLEEQGDTLEEIQTYLKQKFGVLHIPRFPLFISMAKQNVLVVGAGKIAARRIAVLQQFGAHITVVAPSIICEIDQTQVDFRRRNFEANDIAQMRMVIAATDNRVVNHQIAVLCQQNDIPVSVADCASESTFYFPAVCIGGGLVAGLVSDGSDHAAVSSTAKKIRDILG